MKRFKIFISRQDNFFDAALKMKEISKIKTEIIYIEDFVNHNLYNEVNDKDMVYFLCNGEKVVKVLEKISNSKCFVFNSKFLLSKTKKSQTQKMAFESGLNVPNIIKLSEITDKNLPIFCKEDSHTGLVFQAYTMNTINKFFERFEKDQFYLEEAIINKNSFEEIKAYYANGQTYLKDNEKLTDEKICDICEIISKKLYSIELFSVDLMKRESDYYVIDINTAPGFYSSTKARVHFINSMINIYEENEYQL